MGKIISEVSAKLTKTLDKDVAIVVGKQIGKDVEDILTSLSEKSYIYLGEVGDDDQTNS